MRHIQTLAACGALTVGALAGVAPAAVVALYDGSGFSTSAGTFPSVDTDSLSTASTLTAGLALRNQSPVGFGTTAGATDSTGILVRAVYTPDNLAAAKAQESSITFSIAPAAGYSLTLTSLSFDFAITYSNSGTMNSTVEVYVGDTAYGPAITRAVNGTGSWSGATVNFSQPITVTSSTVVTMYIYDDQGSGGVERFDNIALQGSTAAVPEPASVAVLAATGLGLLMARRKNCH